MTRNSITYTAFMLSDGWNERAPRLTMSWLRPAFFISASATGRSRSPSGRRALSDAAISSCVSTVSCLIVLPWYLWSELAHAYSTGSSPGHCNSVGKPCRAACSSVGGI